MSKWLWENYTIYFFDEDNGKNYIKDFFILLAKRDADKVAQIFKEFFDRIEEGIGISSDYFKSKRIKHLKNEIFYEFREKSLILKKPIRIYFYPDVERKRIIVLNAVFKENNKTQHKDIDLSRRRLKLYFSEYGGGQ